MNVVYSSKGIVNIDSPGRGVSVMARAGVENIVMDFSTWWDDQILDRVCAEFDKNGMCVSGAIAPDMWANEGRACSNEFLLRLTETCIRTCGKIGCPRLIIPAFPVKVTSNGDSAVQAAGYQRLAAVARENGITLLLKNECKNVNGHLVRGTFCDAKEAAEFLDMLNAGATPAVQRQDGKAGQSGGAKMQRTMSEQGGKTGQSRGAKTDLLTFGFCLDVGVCNICGQNMYEFVQALGSRLKAVVLRDNDGRAEASLLPFANAGAFGARTDWRGLICGLRDIDFDGMVILSFSDSFCVMPGVLRTKYLDFAKSMGDYFKWQVGQRRVLAKYESRVLFGAGNMCRNYMKYYGGEFPPLFTCDNNKRLWDTEFEGLVVKNPEELKKLPKDCAIFICNIYYGEIAEQLRDMGVENPIEYFNDEYLPFGRD